MENVSLYNYPKKPGRLLLVLEVDSAGKFVPQDSFLVDKNGRMIRITNATIDPSFKLTFDDLIYGRMVNAVTISQDEEWTDPTPEAVVNIFNQVEKKCLYNLT